MVTSGPHHTWNTADDCTMQDTLYVFIQMIWSYWTQNYKCLNVLLTVDGNAPPHGRHLVKQRQIETIRGSALIGRGVRPMGASVCAETIVRRVAAESRLFLVGPAWLAISVSGRAGRRGRTVGGRTFLFTNLPPTSPPHQHHHRRLRRSPCVFVRWQPWWSSTSPPQKPFRLMGCT